MLYGHKILVFCTSKIYEDRFYDFISSFNDEISKYNWRILIFCTESDLYKDNKNNRGEKNIFDLINFKIADALLLEEGNILNEAVKSKLIDKAKKVNIPVILLDGKREGCYNINFNQKQGFERVCRHIIEHHRISNIHFIAGPKESDVSNERINVFKKVLRDNNIEYKPSMLSYGDFWEIPTQKVIKKLVDENRIPRAIICANDSMAITATTTLKKYGYYCPEDVLVTGFDGINSIFFATPKITSVICDLKSMGHQTANLLHKIEKEKIPPCNIDINPTLFLSESCGCSARQPSNTIDFFTKITENFAQFRAENTSLNNLAVTIHDCKCINEVIARLKNKLLYDMFFLVKAECIDSSLEPNKSHSRSVYGNRMFLLADSNNSKEPQSRFIRTKDLLPRMEELLEKHIHPLIFAPVNNTELPIGYICFTYNNYDQLNYTKVAQIASWLGNAISGYRNAQYLRYLQAKLEESYRYDPLTGLYNRNGFIRFYNQYFENDSIQILTMAMCDLDNLKHINDNYSHFEGDNAINIVGKALSSAIEGGTYCRYGGDEILGLYKGYIEPELIKEKIQNYIDEYNKTSGKPYTISASVGVYSSHKTKFESLFAKADSLMYEEKQRKKGISRYADQFDKDKEVNFDDKIS